MPYIIVRGNLASYASYGRDPWRVLVSGLKANDIEQLKRFPSGGYCDDSTIVYMQHPCTILTALEVLGYKVIASSSTSVKQDYNEYMWTMRKDFPEPEPDIVIPNKNNPSLHSGDSSVFGLSSDEEQALNTKFPESANVVNGLLIKAPPISVVNTLSELGYRVLCCAGETELTWTLIMDTCNGHSHASSSVQQTLDELDFERGIWYAAQYGDEDRVMSLLKKGIDVNIEDRSGYTALHYAARGGHRRVCERLIASGADVNKQTRAGRATALHRSSLAGHLEIMQILINAGAKCEMLDADGKTVLHRAVEGNHTRVVKFLMETRPGLAVMKDHKGRIPKELIQDNNLELCQAFLYV